MNKESYSSRLQEVVITCGMNIRYHQTMEWRFSLADKILKVLVGIAAIAGAVLAVPNIGVPWVGFGVAMAAGILAVALNVVPVGEKEKVHGELFRLWSDLRKDAIQEEHKTFDRDIENPANKHFCERLGELISKMDCLHASETAAWPKLLLKCQEDENEAAWGPGVRTFAEVEKASRDLRQAEGPAAPTSVSTEGEGAGAAAV